MPPPTVSSGEPAAVTRRARRLSAAGLVGFVGASAALVLANGLILSRDWLFAWVLLGLLAVSLADVKRWARGVLVDWLPLMAVLLFYDLSKPVSEWLGAQPHVLPQLDVDRWLTGGAIPSIALQDALYRPAATHWYDVAIFFVYVSHFFVTLLVAAALWRVAHERFREWRALVVTLASAGFVTYVLFPAVPPWLAAWDRHIAPVHRVIADMWSQIGIEPAEALFENHGEFYNQVAAVPSLHAAYPLLLALFAWPRARRWLRALLAAYVLAMGFALVYTGEHYVADVLLGWVYAAATYAAVTAFRRRRALQREQRA
jgi:membrane-associated phospholipid phosphatase